MTDENVIRANAGGWPLRRVLVGVSSAPEDDAVLEVAMGLARRAGAELYAVHAEERTPVAADVPSGEAEEPPAEARIAGRLAELATPGARVAAVVARGPAHRVLDREARRLTPDLIVVGATAGGRRRLGSTAERVAQRAWCPVLVVRAPLPIPPRRLLAPVDLSLLSADGLRCGLEVVARSGGGEVAVTALLAIGFLDPLSARMRREGWSEKELLAHAGADLDAFLAEHRPDLPFALRKEVVLGPAREEIVRSAAEHDLVVMATHGHGGFERLLLGSVAATVVREAPCSVLLVPPRAAWDEALAEAVQYQTSPDRPAAER
jgi:nucleotide-binding universal stress UspA family protein